MSAQGSRRMSYAILEDLFETVSAKSVAYEMHIDKSLVYGWGKDPDTEDMLNPGKRNPLDRTRILLSMAVTQGRRDIALEIVNWLAAELQGVFIGDEQMESIEKLVNAVKEQANPQLKKVK